MDIALIVLSIVLALAAVATAIAKLIGQADVIDTLERLEVPEAWRPWLAAAEIAGAAGLLIGMAWTPVGLAAAAGLSLYFLGAVIAHVRAHDTQLAAAAVLAIIAVATCSTYALNPGS